MFFSPFSLEADRRVASLTSELVALKAQTADEKDRFVRTISALESQAQDHKRASETSVQFAASLQGQVEALMGELQGNEQRLSASASRVAELEVALSAQAMQSEGAAAAHSRAMEASAAELRAAELSLREAEEALGLGRISAADLKRALEELRSEHAGVISDRDQLLGQTNSLQEELQGARTALRTKTDEAALLNSLTQVGRGWCVCVWRGCISLLDGEAFSILPIRMGSCR